MLKLNICYTYFINIIIRLWFGPGTFLTRHNDQLPSLSGVHGLKDFLCSAHLLESFDGRIYTYWSVLKSKFVHQRTQEDEHYRENPSNHELLTVRGVDRRAFLKMFRGQITVYSRLVLEKGGGGEFHFVGSHALKVGQSCLESWRSPPHLKHKSEGFTLAWPSCNYPWDG